MKPSAAPVPASTEPAGPSPSKSPDSLSGSADDQSIVRMFRHLAAIGAVSILLFSWVHEAAEPHAWDPMGLRLLIAGACMAIFVGTWFLPRRVLVRVAYAAFYLITGWILWLLAANQLSENYALALVVVAAGMAGAFQDRRSLLFYQIATLVGVAAAAITVDAPRMDLVVFFTYAVVMATLVYVSVSLRLELDRRRAESERRYALAAYGANDGLWDWDLTAGTVYYSDRWKEMAGLAPDEEGPTPDQWLERIHPADRERVAREMDPRRSSEPHRSIEFRMRRGDGGWKWVLSRGAVFRDEAGQPVRMAGSLSDIAARKYIEEQLVHDALHDALTGLPNRVLLSDRLERLLTTTRRHAQASFAVVYLDLDRFKRVNDSQGHESGDRLLVEVAWRLRAQLRDEDTLARVGGDEFVAIFPHLTDADDALRAAERLQAALAEPISVDGTPVYLTASLGVVLGPDGYTAPGEILRDADIAMFRCKKERLSRPRLFDEAMHQQAVHQLTMETELRHAVDRGELVLHYQPIILLESGRVDAWEALVRWQHPDRGLIPPAGFLPLAEESGLIVDIGRWAMREACAAHRRWRATLGFEPPTIHVNLSGAHFSAGSVLQDVAAAMNEERKGARLGIEITETVLLEDPAAVAGVLLELRRQGVSVSIDDFGTGYSSLRYLHSLPADTLKIDRSFVQRTHERGGADLVQTIVLLAERLGMTTVAEGVEDRAVAARLRAAGASHAQGFLYSPPVEEREAANIMTAEPAGWFTRAAE